MKLILSFFHLNFNNKKLAIIKVQTEPIQIHKNSGELPFHNTVINKLDSKNNNSDKITFDSKEEDSLVTRKKIKKKKRSITDHQSPSISNGFGNPFLNDIDDPESFSVVSQDEIDKIS